jgi:hypothetical protein
MYYFSDRVKLRVNDELRKRRFAWRGKRFAWRVHSLSAGELDDGIGPIRPHGFILVVIPIGWFWLYWTHSADGRPSGSSLQVGEEELDWTVVLDPFG